MDENYKIISEIANELKEEVTPEQYENLKAEISARGLNSMLIEEGLLYRGENGCRATANGFDAGIIEAERVKEDGTTYIQTMYSPSAEKLVRNLVYTAHPEIKRMHAGKSLTEGYAIRKKYSPDNFNYSRKFNETLLEKYPNYLIFLGDDEFYWVYDSCAEDLAELLDVELYRNAKRQVGFRFKYDLLDDILRRVEDYKLDYIVADSDEIAIYVNYQKPIVSVPPVEVPPAVINEPVVIELPKGETEKPSQPKPPKEDKPSVTKPEEPKAQPEPGNKFEKRITRDVPFTLAYEGTKDDFVICERNTIPKIITRADGTLETIDVPVDDEKIKIVSPNTDLAIEALGKKEGDVFSIGDTTFRIVYINKKIN